MESVVQNSLSSLYSTYISTVDHLPCDIVRSLWLVQTCNLALDKEKQDLHHLLQKHNAQLVLDGAGLGVDDVAHQFFQKQTRIRRWHDEAVAELDSLCNQLGAHEKMVKDQISQLQLVADTPMAKNADTLEQLRQQLRDHYRENPLSSQVEALNQHERVLHDLGKVVIKKAPGNGAGIKIIFKLSPAGVGNHLRKKQSPAPDTPRKVGRPRGSRGTTAPIEEVKPVHPRAAAGHTAQLNGGGRHSLRTREREAVKVEAVDRVEKRAPRLVPKQAVAKAAKVTKVTKAPLKQTVKSKKQKVAVHLPEPVFKAPPEQIEDTALYCFCKQRSFGDMIACDNEQCPNGEWFHYKCVGLLNRVEALRFTTEKWYCSPECRAATPVKPAGKKRGRKKKKKSKSY